MSNEIMRYLFLGGGAIALYIFLKTLIPMFFGVNDTELHESRLRQLDFERESIAKAKASTSDDEQIRKFVEDFTTPIIKHVMPNVAYRKDLETLERNLKFADFDKYFTPAQYIVFILALRVIGTIVLCILLPFAWPPAVMAFVGLAIFPTMLFTNNVKNKKELLLLGFPEFINIAKSYLSSGMTFEKAVEESIVYVNKEWQELLKSYLINSQTLSRKESLQMMALDSNLFEVQEFMSLVQLNIEQGIDVKDSFERQYGKVKDLQKLAVLKKIESRKVWTIFVQAPVLLTIIGAFGLPMVESFSSLGGM
jgi:Flp pilus assembly protein TadB